jgi:hypothetical protein
MPTLRQLRTEELLVRTRLGFTICGVPLSIVSLGFGAKEQSGGVEEMSGGARLHREANCYRPTLIFPDFSLFFLAF